MHIDLPLSFYYIKTSSQWIRRKKKLNCNIRMKRFVDNENWIDRLLMYSSIVFHNDVGDLSRRKKKEHKKREIEEEKKKNYFLHIT
jgi:hypothetical protein